MTDWISPEDEKLKNLNQEALDCRSSGRHNFGKLREEVEDGRYVVELNLKQMSLEIPCKDGCGVLLKVSYMVHRHPGRQISRSLDYSMAVDADGNPTYLFPKGSGRLHPEDARAEVFDRLNVRARTGPSKVTDISSKRRSAA